MHWQQVVPAQHKTPPIYKVVEVLILRDGRNGFRLLGCLRVLGWRFLLDFDEVAAFSVDGLFSFGF
jgi:hypothetical protein